MSLNETMPSSTLGRAEKIIVNKDQTIIVNGMATSEEIVDYAKGIENSIKDITSEYDNGLQNYLVVLP